MRKLRACPRTCVRMAVLHWDTYSRHVTCVRNTSMEYSSILIHNTCMYCAYIISATMVKSRTYVQSSLESVEIKTLSIHLGCCGAPSYQYIGKITSNNSMLHFTQVCGQSHTQKQKWEVVYLGDWHQSHRFNISKHTLIHRQLTDLSVLPLCCPR